VIYLTLFNILSLLNHIDNISTVENQLYQYLFYILQMNMRTAH